VKVTEGAIKWAPWIPHDPTKNVKQLAFLMYTGQEALYGGAAGGGKSDALLMAALQYTDVPGYSALLLRRTYPELAKSDGLIPRSIEWLNGKGPDWHETKKLWQFPSGARLEFGHLMRTNDMYRYQSAEYNFIGFDELTTFEEDQYRYMFSRLRRLESSDVPLRMRAGSNPGGIGHDWVSQRFLVEGPASGRLFIPANLDDNPFLDKESYEHSLNELDPTTRRQLRYGDWNARRRGAMFQRSWFPIVAEPPEKVDRRIRFWDLASTEPGRRNKNPDWTVGALVSLWNGVWYIEDIVRLQQSPGKVEAMVSKVAKQDGMTSIRMEQEPGASGVAVIDSYATRVLVGHDFKGVPMRGDKLIRAKPLASAAELGKVRLVSAPWNNTFVDELESVPGNHDDQMDAVSAAMSVIRPSTGFYDFHQGTESVMADLELLEAERRERQIGQVRGRVETKQYAMTEIF